MNVDQLLQDLSIRVYEEPLSLVREEAEYPNLDNPLHLAVLLIDCDTEISMNGMLGFIENSSGQHLPSTIDALDQIGAATAAKILRSVQECMSLHSVSWESLRQDFEAHEDFEITTFAELHSGCPDGFAEEVCSRFSGFSLFYSNDAVEDAYSLLVRHLEPLSNRLANEIMKRETGAVH